MRIWAKPVRAIKSVVITPVEIATETVIATVPEIRTKNRLGNAPLAHQPMKLRRRVRAAIAIGLNVSDVDVDTVVRQSLKRLLTNWGV